jgi:hypothetical protein
MRKVLLLTVIAGLTLGVLGSASAKPTVVWTDAKGDAGNQDSGVPGADQAGFDLVSGSITKVAAGLQFTATQAAMPASGPPGEAFRLLWHFDVGSTQYRFTVKSLDVGKPDVVAQTGTERVGQVYQGVARLESCYIDATLPLQLSQCKVLAYYPAKFDSGSASETWTMPLADVKAKKGTIIAPGTGGAVGTGCSVCWIPHYAERSLTPHTIIDSAVITTSYKV